METREDTSRIGRLPLALSAVIWLFAFGVALWQWSATGVRPRWSALVSPVGWIYFTFIFLRDRQLSFTPRAKRLFSYLMLFLAVLELIDIGLHD